MLLTIDAGNTRTKWAVFSASGEVKTRGVCLNSELANAEFSPALLVYQRVVISNVAGDQHAALLAAKLAPHSLAIQWAKASAQACGVRNNYHLPATLGADRWAALIAAWCIQRAPCVVVNMGTAVTIDALNVNQTAAICQAEFIGGIILPGLNLMRSSLGLATAQLPRIDQLQNTAELLAMEIFATNTKDAIYAGSIHAALGAMMLMARSLTDRCGQVPDIIIGGGDAVLLHQTIMAERNIKWMGQALVVNDLVLQGLYYLESENP